MKGLILRVAVVAAMGVLALAEPTRAAEPCMDTFTCIPESDQCPDTYTLITSYCPAIAPAAGCTPYQATCLPGSDCGWGWNTVWCAYSP